MPEVIHGLRLYANGVGFVNLFYDANLFLLVVILRV